MDTTVKALQNLYVAKGGSLADVENISTIPDMINAIAELLKTGNAKQTATNSTKKTIKGVKIND